jgi:hypothetical protein
MDGISELVVQNSKRVHRTGWLTVCHTGLSGSRALCMNRAVLDLDHALAPDPRFMTAMRSKKETSLSMNLSGPVGLGGPRRAAPVRSTVPVRRSETDSPYRQRFMVPEHAHWRKEAFREPHRVGFQGTRDRPRQAPLFTRALATPVPQPMEFSGTFAAVFRSLALRMLILVHQVLFACPLSPAFCGESDRQNISARQTNATMSATR